LTGKGCGNLSKITESKIRLGTIDNLNGLLTWRIGELQEKYAKALGTIDNLNGLLTTGFLGLKMNFITSS
jgi:hypothetical protein